MERLKVFRLSTHQTSSSMIVTSLGSGWGLVVTKNVAQRNFLLYFLRVLCASSVSSVQRFYPFSPVKTTPWINQRCARK